ncbi:unnamed protein product, partial [Mesorhabditis spiculigera]
MRRFLCVLMFICLAQLCLVQVANAAPGMAMTRIQEVFRSLGANKEGRPKKYFLEPIYGVEDAGCRFHVSKMSGKKKKAAKSVSPVEEEVGSQWECSVCTYINRFEAFKCEMCDTRKGTSTRKPRLNENVVETQKVVENFIIQQQHIPKIAKRKLSDVAGTDQPGCSRLPPLPEVPELHFPMLDTALDPPLPKRKHIPLPDHLIDRNKFIQVEVVVNNVKALITEFRPRNPPPLSWFQSDNPPPDPAQ